MSNISKSLCPFPKRIDLSKAAILTHDFPGNIGVKLSISLINQQQHTPSKYDSCIVP